MTSGLPLPARVRVTRPPLPLSPALSQAAQRLLPGGAVTRAQAVALAVAGGQVIGVGVSLEPQAAGEAVSPNVAVAAGWRGKGIEAALVRELSDTAVDTQS